GAPAGAARGVQGGGPAAEAGRRAARRVPRSAGLVGAPPRPPLSHLLHRAPAALRPHHSPSTARALPPRARRGTRARELVPARVLAAAGACAGRASANARPGRVVAAGGGGGEPLGRRLPASRQRVDDEPADAMRLVAVPLERLDDRDRVEEAAVEDERMPVLSYRALVRRGGGGERGQRPVGPPPGGRGARGRRAFSRDSR